MKNKNWGIAIFILILFLTVACSYFVIKYEMKNKKVSIDGINHDGIVFIRKIEIQNDNTSISTSSDSGTGNSDTGILPFDSGVEGNVSLGPTCPVMRNPPDPNCADRPYTTTIQIITVGSPKSSPFATVKSDKNGHYKIMLPPGNYAIQPVGGSMLPRCETREVTVIPTKIIKIDLLCDTGIR